MEILQTSNVMSFDLRLRPAQFASARQESVDEFGRALPPNVWEIILEDSSHGPSSCQRDPAPAGDQWPLPSTSFDRDLQDPSGTCGGLPDSPVTGPDLVDADLGLVSQRLGQGPFHDIPEQAEPVSVVGQLVVLRDAPEFRLVP